MEETVQDSDASNSYLLRAFSSRAFRQDAALVSRVDLDLVNSIAAELKSHDRFINRKVLRLLLETYIKDDEVRKSVARYIWNLQAYYQASDLEIDKYLMRCEAALKKITLNSEISFSDLYQRTLILVQPFPGFARFWKAARLESRTGQKITDVSVICDIRPVFDDTRTQLQSIVTISTLRLDYTTVIGEEKTVELRLDKELLTQLRDEAVQALVKVATIEEFFEGGALDVAKLHEDDE